MDFSFSSIEISTVFLLILFSIGSRVFLEMQGQRWITTYANTATFALLPVITYVITKVISGNIALSLGMVGALSIVRFRNPVRSPLELSAYFAAITMGIAASVHIKWLLFFVASIFAVGFCLSLASMISQAFFKRPFFQASFAEGNSLSTLEVSASGQIGALDESALLKSKSVGDNGTNYLLVSSDFETLKKLLATIEADQHLVQYQLNA